MFQEIPMRTLRAVEEVFVFGLFGFGGGGVGVWVGDFGGAAVGADVDGLVEADEGGEGGCQEDVAVVEERC
jgi:hypothetical protein